MRGLDDARDQLTKATTLVQVRAKTVKFLKDASDKLKIRRVPYLAMRMKFDLAGSDLWIYGVMMYLLLCGYLPFLGDNNADVLAKVRLGNFIFDDARRTSRSSPGSTPR